MAFGIGSVCYAPSDAAILGLTLDALVSLYLERKACEHGPHARETVDPKAPPVVP